MAITGPFLPNAGVSPLCFLSYLLFNFFRVHLTRGMKKQAVTRFIRAIRVIRG